MNAKKKKLIYNCVTFGLVIAAFVILTVMINNKSISRSLKGQLIPICCWIVMAVSLNLVVGISGELSLGHAGFMSIGAFTGIVVSGWMLNGFGVTDGTVRLVLAMVMGGVTAGIAGVLIGIPVLRLRGDYLAIVTLAFGEIIKNVMNCIYISVDGTHLRLGFLNPDLPGTILLNGPNGAKGVKTVSTFTAGFILVLITLVVVLNLVTSRAGRAIQATRDNRIAAESMGVPVTRYKMMAFVTASALAGMAGALYGLNMATLVPTKFSFNESINVLVFVVMGGIGNTLGSVISATALTILPERLRFLQSYRMLIYAIVLILVMVLGNNPTLKNWFRSFVNRVFRRGEKGDAPGKEVTGHE
jgi:branched-chain amino acid transport system permease protein